MDEYIKREDALKIIDNYSKAVTEEGKVVVDAIRDIIAVITPTADVVPKSEVDRWKQINEQLHKEMSERMVEELKIERRLVAREIFEEIEELAKIYTFPVVKNGVVEIAKEPFWCIEPNDLTELKKKHTEVNDDKTDDHI